MILEKYGVAEISHQELLTTEGGFIIALGVCLFALGVATVLLMV